MRPAVRFTAAALFLLPTLAAVARPGAGEPGAAASPAVAGESPLESGAVMLDGSLEPARGKRPYDSARGFRAPFAVRVDGEPVEMAVTAVTVLPGDALTLEIPAGATVTHSAGGMTLRDDGSLTWTAPAAPGIHSLLVRQGGGDAAAEVRVNLLVAHSAAGMTDGVLNGYRIGAYRREPLRGDPAYLPPRGFIEVRPQDHDVLVSPHFTLGEFLCKQEGEPRYVVVSAPLLLKLELILEAANEAGIRASGFTVMSGFRTPFYNRAIGNTTDYSRHLWGDAADIYVDEDGDGEMDDLNGDGVRNVADARVLAGVVESLAASERDDYPVGGMASYRRNPAHGPFVHVDARGVRARW